MEFAHHVPDEKPTPISRRLISLLLRKPSVNIEEITPLPSGKGEEFR